MSQSKSYLERNLARFASTLHESIVAEETASRQGVLQRMDPRVKIVGFLALLLANAFSHSLTVILCVYAFAMILALISGVLSFSFVRKLWIFMPFFSSIVAVPALFTTPGQPWIALPFFSLVITHQGARAAAFLVLRVATSVSFLLLLSLTTPWAKILKALRTLHCPRLFVFLLAVTHRYIYVLLQSASAMFLARKSRKVGPEDYQSTTAWLGGILTSLLRKSYHLSSEVYLAMQSRGFRGEPVIGTEFRLRIADVFWFFVMIGVSSASFYFGYWMKR